MAGIILLAFVLGLVIGSALVFWNDAAVMINGVKSGFMTVDYKDKTYRLVDVHLPCQSEERGSKLHRWRGRSRSPFIAR